MPNPSFDLVEYLQERLNGLWNLGVTTTGKVGMFRCLAEEIIAAGFSEDELALALHCVTTPDPAICALRGAYRDVHREGTTLSQLVYRELQHIRATVLHIVVQGTGTTIPEMRKRCVANAPPGFRPTTKQVEAVVQHYVALGVIRRIKVGRNGTYVIV